MPSHSGNTARVAVIQFPGVNCEYETQRALISSGLDATIFRWNLQVSLLASFDAFVLPGGFSYQDRVRAGAIAAKDSIVEEIATQALKGRPVLGICNGAQVLVEAGLVPGLSDAPQTIRGAEDGTKTFDGIVQMALSPNKSAGRSGYLCEWVYVKVSEPASSAFTCALDDGDVIPLPIAHAEGRFVSASRDVTETLGKERLTRLRYCDETGRVREEFPWNPNGSILSAAAISNRNGNVLAMMPHPERASWLRQVPEWIHGEWGRRKKDAKGLFNKMEEPGPGSKIFDSLKRYLG